MRAIVLALPALLLAGCSTAQVDGRGSRPTDPAAKVRAVAFSSAFEGYRPFADQELQDWRKANEEVGAGHAGHRSGQGPGQHK